VPDDLFGNKTHKKSYFGSSASTLSSPQMNPTKQIEEVRSLLLDSSDSDEIESLL
jgi:hypothetical protein